MKISDAMRLPYPVLAPFLTDYQTAEFVANIIEVKEDLSRFSIELSMETEVTDGNLRSLIDDGHASAGIFVTGVETYFNEPRKVSLGAYRVKFDSGALKGRVVIRPVIWAEQDISGFWSNDFHPEFKLSRYAPKKGSLLAVGNEVVVHVGREKLAPLESIFALRAVPEFDRRKSAIDPDGDKIAIMVDQATYEAIVALRANEVGQGVLMNALYLPAVMEVLSSLASGTSDFSSRRWHDAFISKCEHLGISPTSPNLLEDGQKLLEYPASFLTTAVERMDR